MVDEPNKTERLLLTKALEDYLETIYRLVRDSSFARVRDIAKARQVRAGSVSPALKRLSDLGLVRYERREYVTLTEQGEQQARRVYARHQLLDRFFSQILGMDEEAAEKQACIMEHSLSDLAMDKMVRFFEFLAVCPGAGSDFLERFHGCSFVHDDVPRCKEKCPVEHGNKRKGHQSMSLFELQPGQKGVVTQVGAQGAIRQRLLDMGILPSCRIEMERVAPAGEPVWIKLHGTQLALRKLEAKAVAVTPA